MKFVDLKPLILILIFVHFLLAACRSDNSTVPPTLAPTVVQSGGEVVVQTESEAETAVPTPIPPTPTPSEPLAAIVNGEEILLSAYEKQLARFQQSDPNSGIDYRPVALNSLIDNALITQAAQAAGFSVEETQIDQEILSLIEAAEGRENFEAWLERNFYTEEELRDEIAFGILYAPLVTEVAASVPTTSEQVRASYIKVSDEALANDLLNRIQNGEDFATLANQNSIPLLNSQSSSGGDIGFFGREWALQNVPPNFQETALTLDPGQAVLLPPFVEEDGVTYYYILQTTEKNAQQPLPQPILDQLRQEAVVEWTTSLRDNAEISILIDLGS